MSQPVPRAKSRTTVDTRRILVEPEHPIIGQDYAGQGDPLRWQIETVGVNLLRDGSSGPWILGTVVARGQYLIPAGPSGMSFDREYRSDVDDSARYHHSDMPTPLAQLVHDETVEPDAGDHPDVAAAVAQVARMIRETFPDRSGNVHRALATLLQERMMAWAALPESVRGDAAPEGTTLADRITALVMERDAARNNARRCHVRHIRLEPVVRELVEVLEDGELYASAPGAWHERTKRRLAPVRAVLAERMTVADDAPHLVIRWDYDDHITLLVEGQEVMTADHDAHGWDGMRAVIDTAEKIAKVLGLRIETEGKPNL